MLAALGSFASRAILPVAAKIGKLGLNAAKSLGSKLVNHGTQAVTNIAKKALAG